MHLILKKFSKITIVRLIMKQGFNGLNWSCTIYMSSKSVNLRFTHLKASLLTIMPQRYSNQFCQSHLSAPSLHRHYTFPSQCPWHLPPCFISEIVFMYVPGSECLPWASIVIPTHGDIKDKTSHCFFTCTCQSGLLY